MLVTITYFQKRLKLAGYSLTLKLSHYRSFKLIGLHSVCAVIFAAGFALREYSSYHYIYDPDGSATLIVFILSQVFIYACP